MRDTGGVEELTRAYKCCGYRGDLLDPDRGKLYIRDILYLPDLAHSVSPIFHNTVINCLTASMTAQYFLGPAKSRTHHVGEETH